MAHYLVCGSISCDAETRRGQFGPFRRRHTFRHLLFIAIELAAPALLMFAFVTSKFSFSFQSDPPLNSHEIILAAVYLAHLTNRVSLLLRAPSHFNSQTVSSIAAVIPHTFHS
ncbi:hypothetical protein LshimejAT787_0505960 [Lyophyllum shimeji]|uniref:Uncharacterized protein n=1 Tax=Lyophyllum shimeji TaxID=47721 RepID=A0A9P3PNW8_LYOSH|nr:hypothetical protein LshimejAT787_0505960 [Lyophyllum shimeji]